MFLAFWRPTIMYSVTCLWSGFCDLDMCDLGLCDQGDCDLVDVHGTVDLQPSFGTVCQLGFIKWATPELWPSPWRVFFFFRHTSDLDIWNELITSCRFLAMYEPRDKKTTGSHQQSGLLKKLILHIQYICTFKCIFEVFITWFAAQYFSILHCANIMQSREPPFVINRTDFSWNCKSLFRDGNNAWLRRSTELGWPLESTSPSR